MSAFRYKVDVIVDADLPFAPLKSEIFNFAVLFLKYHVKALNAVCLHRFWQGRWCEVKRCNL